MYKHTTVYEYKGRKMLYTTKSLTPVHERIRRVWRGTTYEHSVDTVFWFVVDCLLLPSPIGNHVKEISYED